MHDKDDLLIYNLVDNDRLKEYFNAVYKLINGYVIIIDPNGNVLDIIDDLNKDIVVYNEVKKEIIDFLKNNEIKDSYVYSTLKTNYRIYINKITIYNTFTAIFAIFTGDEIFDIDKVEILYNMFYESLKGKFEIDDLTRDVVSHYKQMSLFSLINEGVLNGLNIKEIFDKTLEVSIERTEGELGLAFYLNEEQLLELISIKPDFEEKKVGYALFLDDNIFANSLINNISVIYNDIKKNKNFIHPLPFISASNYLISPIFFKNSKLGVIVICNKKNNQDFNSMDKKTLDTIAGQAALTIENHKLFIKLKENFIHTIESLSAAIDMKDTYTIGHSKRVSQVAIAIAVEMGITDTQIIEDIKIGSLLHDIGKIGIPSDLLFKPEKPDEIEWEIIRKHPQNGYDIAKNLSGFEGILPTIKHHHERWDGKGYPSGLKGDEIPLATRIVSVADAYDTIISRRPYKEPFTSEEACVAISRASGSQFDPVIVDAFISAYKKGRIEKQGEN